MKFIDKLKNVFFEEVEEDEEELPQTFARKVEPHKKHENLTPIKENNHVEIEKRFEERKEPREFKEEKIDVQENKDDEMDFQIKPRDLVKEKEPEKTFPMMFDEEDFLEDNQVAKEEVEPPKDEKSEPLYRRERSNYDDEKELYQGKREISYAESVAKPTYSYTRSFYEEKETKGFKPSPIISPIYGILDKNYRKEEVITKRETRITSTYHKPDLDTVRNKAFGSSEDEEKEIRKEEKKEVSEPANRKVYDVNNNKPQVNRVTLADADEYYNDLGLAYNVDYSDASRNMSRTQKYSNKKQEDKVDDNLFDLVDSMYNKED